MKALPNRGAFAISASHRFFVPAGRPVTFRPVGMGCLGYFFLVFGGLLLATAFVPEMRDVVDNTEEGDAKSTLIFVGVLFLAMGVGFWFLGRFLRTGELEAERLLTEGIRGQARVLSVAPTNIRVNEDPLVSLELEVTRDQFHPPYRVGTSQLVPVVMVPLLHQDRPLPVIVDPHDPQKLLIDWSEAGRRDIE